MVVIDAAHDGRYQRDTHFQRVTDGDGALFKFQKRTCAEHFISGVIQSIKLQEDDADARVAKRPRIVRLLREANAVGVELDVLAPERARIARQLRQIVAHGRLTAGKLQKRLAAAFHKISNRRFERFQRRLRITLGSVCEAEAAPEVAAVRDLQQRAAGRALMLRA